MIFGEKGDLVVSNKGETCAVATADIATPSLFSNLTAGWKPVATKSRRFSEVDKNYIASVLRNGKKLALYDQAIVLGGLNV